MHKVISVGDGIPTKINAPREACVRLNLNSRKTDKKRRKREGDGIASIVPSRFFFMLLHKKQKYETSIF